MQRIRFLKYLFPRAKRNRALRNTELENAKIIPTGLSTPPEPKKEDKFYQALKNFV